MESSKSFTNLFTPFDEVMYPEIDIFAKIMIWVIVISNYDLENAWKSFPVYFQGLSLIDLLFNCKSPQPVLAWDLYQLTDLLKQRDMCFRTKCRVFWKSRILWKQNNAENKRACRAKSGSRWLEIAASSGDEFKTVSKFVSVTNVHKTCLPASFLVQ